VVTAGLLAKGESDMSSEDADLSVRSAFRRASFCASSECVEVAQRDDVIILRDSAQPNANMLHYGAEEWRSFVRNVKADAFDVLRL
jgi:hypothetical protein